MKTTEKELRRIVQHLILHSSFTGNLGLRNGKMGFILSFFKYADFTKERLYRTFAEELIQEIYEDISQNEPIDFENGSCGIAWGICYLVQNGFVKANEDEVLKELDIKISEKDVRRVTDYSLETGLKVPIDTRNNERYININKLSEQINYLLENPTLALQLSVNARKRFLEEYELNLFKEKMLAVYNS